MAKNNFEFQIQCYVATMAKRDGYLFHADSNGANKGIVGGCRAKASGARAGWPDLTFIGVGSGIIFIELKTQINGKKSKLNQEQKKLHAELIYCGHKIYVVYASGEVDGWNQIKSILDFEKICPAISDGASLQGS